MTLTPVTTLVRDLTATHVRLRLELIDSSDAAIKVREPGTGVEAWLPRRAVVDMNDGTFSVPKRLAARKGLCG